MSILIDGDTRLLVHGITGRQGMFHSERMLEYGTNVVGGLTPGKGGQWVFGLPVFDTAKQAVEATGANCSMISVPARFAADSIYEAADSDVPLIVCLTEGIPVQDMLEVRAYLDREGKRLSRLRAGHCLQLHRRLALVVRTSTRAEHRGRSIEEASHG